MLVGRPSVASLDSLCSIRFDADRQRHHADIWWQPNMAVDAERHKLGDVTWRVLAAEALMLRRLAPTCCSTSFSIEAWSQKRPELFWDGLELDFHAQLEALASYQPA